MELFRNIEDRIDFRLNVANEYRKRIASKNLVLEVGAGHQPSGSVLQLRRLSSNPNTKIVTTDICGDHNPDIIDDICNSKIQDNVYDSIYCNAVLEHVENYEAAIQNIHRILRPGGELFIYVPFFYSYHDRVDYHRYTFTEVDRMLRCFDKRKIFMTNDLGYGGVLWKMLTFYKGQYSNKIFRLLAKCTNGCLAAFLIYVFMKRLVKKSIQEPHLRNFYFTILIST